MIKNSKTDYGLIAKILHWGVFIILVMLVISGNILHDMPRGPDKYEFLTIHKSIGSIILLLIMFRLFWRLINPQPDLPNSNSKLQILAAKVVHWVLYVLMMAQALSGVLMTQSYGYSAGVFGLFELPTLVNKSKAFGEFFGTVHHTIWIALITVVIGHILAALYHQFIAKDDVLKRMLFKRKS